MSSQCSSRAPIDVLKERYPCNEDVLTRTLDEIVEKFSWTNLIGIPVKHLDDNVEECCRETWGLDLPATTEARKELSDLLGSIVRAECADRFEKDQRRKYEGSDSDIERIRKTGMRLARIDVDSTDSEMESPSTPSSDSDGGERRSKRAEQRRGRKRSDRAMRQRLRGRHDDVVTERPGTTNGEYRTGHGSASIQNTVASQPVQTAATREEFSRNEMNNGRSHPTAGNSARPAEAVRTNRSAQEKRAEVRKTTGRNVAFPEGLNPNPARTRRTGGYTGSMRSQQRAWNATVDLRPRGNEITTAAAHAGGSSVSSIVHNCVQSETAAIQTQCVIGGEADIFPAVFSWQGLAGRVQQCCIM